MILAVCIRVCYLDAPLGIDCRTPILTWNVDGAKKQSSYQIRLQEGGRTIWDSGKVPGDSMQAVLSDVTFHSRQQIRCRIRLWDEEDRAGEWRGTCWEMGLLEPYDWQADWITGDYAVKKNDRYPADCFRKRFSVGSVKKARLYITACGLYEAAVNGKRVGQFVMAPGHTDYRRRVQYQTYDVGDDLLAGENELTVLLADGWYRGGCGALGRRNQYGTETKLLVQLEITGENGDHTIITSDDSWQWSDDGPIRFADPKDGETVDARCVPSFEGRARITRHPVIPTASNNVPVLERERFTPKRSIAPNGKMLLDFGQNLAGFLAFRAVGHAGDRIHVRMGEMLDRDGNLTLSNIQVRLPGICSPLQEIDYTCSEGVNEYKTRFAVFGFQYAEVDAGEDVRIEKIESVAVYSAIERTGWFTSSNDALNRFVEATVWSAKSNHLDSPTDCPTRERLGWAGDAQIFFDTAAYFFDYAAFSKKYLHDLYDWQKADGKLPQIAPEGGVLLPMKPLDGSAGWADAGILIPYRFWKRYGDLSVLSEFYDGMKRYTEFLIRRIGKRSLQAKPLKIPKKWRRYVVNSGASYGEWAEPRDVYPTSFFETIHIHPDVSTAYTVCTLECMAEIAEALGKRQDSARCRIFASRCRRAYQMLVRMEQYSLDTDRQASLVRPLYFRLLSEKQTAYAKRRLIKALEAYRWRLGTGFLSTPLILDVLSEIDLEAAYRLLENPELPGWLFMAESGASTVWESWEGPTAQEGISSLNHYSKGAVCEWLFSTMCGIRMEGHNHFRIEPRPGGHLTFAKASYRSIMGTVESEWERTDRGVTVRILVPCNCTAAVRLPDGRTEQAAPGRSEFHCAL